MMKVALATAFGASCGLHGQVRQTAATPINSGLQQAERFTAADLFALQKAVDVQISPDGTKVVYVRVSQEIARDRAIKTLWLIDVATGQQRLLSPAPASEPQWSPDGTRVLYGGSAPDGTHQLFVYELNGSTTEQLTHTGPSPSGGKWSRDGKRIAFTAFVPEKSEDRIATPIPKPPGATWAEPLQVIDRFHYRSDGGGDLPFGHTQLFVMSGDGSVVRQVTDGPYDSGEPAWAPDGLSLLFISSRAADRELAPYYTQLFEVRLAEGTTTQVSHWQGSTHGPSISPDGRWIAYTGFEGHGLIYEESRLYIMKRDGSEAHMVSSDLDRDIFSSAWTADSKALFARYDDRGDAKIGRFSLDGGLEGAAEGLDDDSTFSVAHNGTLAYSLGGSSHPAEAALVVTRSSVRQLTHLNDPLLKGKSLGTLTVLPVQSSFDGRPIGAWMMTPPDYDPSRRYPTILSIHGGPYGSYGPQWYSDFQLFAAAGYVVVFGNPRGSITYGFEFSDLIRNDFPGHDYDDLMSIVDAAVARGVADPNRLFVTGGSAGGQLTAWIVGRTNRFRAAAALKPVINVTSNELLTDQYSGAGILFGKQPWEVPQVFWSHSPLSLVGNVATPTLLMVGDRDHRTPPEEAEQFYAALKLRNVATELVLVPGATHESLSARPSQHAAEIATILDWFKRYDQVPQGGRP